MRKILLLTFCLLLTLGVRGATTTTTIDGVKYTLDTSAHTATISGYTSDLPAVVDIPGTFVYDGATYEVTTLGGGAFYKCTTLTHITLPSTITSVGTTSKTYEDLGIPSNLGFLASFKNYTGCGAFAGCTALRTADLSACHFTETKGAMFGGCTVLETVKMPDELQVLTEYDFLTCLNLGTLDFTNTSLTTIGESTFRNTEEDCSKCTNNFVLYLPEGVTTIGSTAFGYTKISKVTDLGNRTTPTPEQVAKYPYLTLESNISAVSHLGSVTSLGTYAFCGCNFLYSIALSNPGLTAIPEHCFTSITNTSFKWVILGTGVTSIGEQGIKNAPYMTSMTYPGSGVTVKSGQALSYEAFVLPPNLKTIDDTAFQTNYGIKKVFLPATLTTIGKDAFKNVTGITDIYAFNTGTTKLWYNDGDIFQYSSFTAEYTPNATLHYISGNYTKASSSWTSATTGWGNYTWKAVVADLTTSYTRPSLKQDVLNTICLPRVARQTSGIDHHTLSHRSPAYLNMQLVDDDALLKAGEPYVILPSMSGDATYEYVYGGEWKTAAASVNGLHGTFEAKTDIQFGDGIYLFLNGSLVEAGNGSGILENRAYVVLDEVPDAPAANTDLTRMREISLGGDGDVSGIQGLTEGTDGAVEAYDLAGRRIWRPAHGFYITADGRKVMVR